MPSSAPWFGAFKPKVLDAFIKGFFYKLGKASSNTELRTGLKQLGKNFSAAMTPFEKIATSELLTAPLGPMGDAVQFSWLGVEGKKLFSKMTGAQRVVSGAVMAASAIKVGTIMVRKTVNTWKKMTENENDKTIPPYRRAYHALEGIEKNHGAPYWSSPTNFNAVIREGTRALSKATTKTLRSQQGGLSVALFNSRIGHTYMGNAKHMKNLDSLFSIKGW